MKLKYEKYQLKKSKILQRHRDMRCKKRSLKTVELLKELFQYLKICKIERKDFKNYVG